jgi:hypothetical protein
MSLTIPANQLRDPLARRSFIERCAKVSFGLSVLPFFSKLAQAAEETGSAPNASLAGFGKAKRVIFIELAGGMSHIDTFDPKTGANKGPATAVSTKAGYQLTSFLPETAKVADKIARHGNPVVIDGVAAGVVTSGTFSPCLKAPIAMGFVAPELAAEGTQLTVEVRGKLVDFGYVAQPLTPEQTVAKIEQERARYGRTVRDAGIRLE